MITLYGIKNCDSVKKARQWLDTHAVEYRFHDFRADGLDPSLLRAWADRAGWETLLNRRGTTFRQLSEAQRSDLDEARALALMQAHPTLIKRPVIDAGHTLLVGFDANRYADLMS